MIRLEKDTAITHTWMEINEEKKMYHGEVVWKSTGTKKYLGGTIANIKQFLYEREYKKFCRIGGIDDNESGC